MATKVGQYCIYVKDLARSEHFYTEVIGLKVQSRTEIENVHEIVLAADSGGGRLQLAERYVDGQDIDHGFALWKTYMHVDDCQEVYDRAMAYGCESQMAPQRLERWPVTVAFIFDPDGYLIELLQMHQDDRTGAV